MSVKTIFFISILLLVLVFQINSNAQTPQSSLRIAYSEFYPFHWTDKTGTLKGIFYDIITEALEKRMRLPLVWTAYPWARCQENLKFGKDDAILTVPTSERSAYTMTHKDPFFKKPLHIYTYVDHPKLTQIMTIKTITDIKNNGFSVVTYSENGWNKKNIQSLGIKTYESPYIENVWQMLVSRRGDLIIEWPVAALPNISRLKLNHQVFDTGILLSDMPFHLLINKDNPMVSVLNSFNTTIQDMKNDGIISTILERYR